jgi:hypothetical protein
MTIYFYFRARVLSAEPKVRISEGKTKNIWIFPNESTFGGAKVRICEQNAKEKSRISIPFSFFIIIFA